MIHACPLAADTLLARQHGEGDYTDCYCTDVPLQVSQSDFIAAFYTTRLFKLERWILRWAVARPSTDAQVMELSLGNRTSFAAWTVESRSCNQLLLVDMRGSTKSWLMTAPCECRGRPGTRLFFGSAILASRNRKAAPPRIGPTFRALLPFHQGYSRLLLRAARQQLMRKDL